MNSIFLNLYLIFLVSKETIINIEDFFNIIFNISLSILIFILLFVLDYFNYFSFFDFLEINQEKKFIFFFLNNLSHGESITMVGIAIGVSSVIPATLFSSYFLWKSRNPVFALIAVIACLLTGIGIMA